MLRKSALVFIVSRTLPGTVAGLYRSVRAYTIVITTGLYRSVIFYTVVIATDEQGKTTPTEEDELLYQRNRPTL